MLTIPAPTFNEQDAVRPIPNLDPARLTSEYTRLTFNFPVLAGDFFILALNSSVLGGTYNQSFNVALDAPSLAILIPTRFVTVSAGTTVSLLARLQRGGITSYAPNASVNIGRLPIIVVPTPTIRWDFNNDAFQGWVPQGIYVGGLLQVTNAHVVVNLPNAVPGVSHIITRPVPVIAGRTYDCSFEVSGNLPSLDNSTVCLTMNGGSIGPDVTRHAQGVIQTGTGTFIAPITGDVRLGILNKTVPAGPHGLLLDNIQMTIRP